MISVCVTRLQLGFTYGNTFSSRVETLGSSEQNNQKKNSSAVGFFLKDT